MRTIKDESELPIDRFVFIRLMSDPTILQDCGTGELFTRADGQKWSHPGYRRYGDDSIVPKTAHCDGNIYPYSETKVA